MTRRWHRNNTEEKLPVRNNEVSPMRSLYSGIAFLFLLKVAHSQIHLSTTTSATVPGLWMHKTASRFRTDGERELSQIYLFNKARRFVKLAQTDFLPAAIHLSAILTPKLLISLNLSPSVTILDWLFLFWCSNSPFASLWHLSIDSLTHAARWQTDLYMRDTRYPVNEYGWSRPSVHLPLGLTDTECWQREAGKNLKMSLMWIKL